jgi:hypothetical protein
MNKKHTADLPFGLCWANFTNLAFFESVWPEKIWLLFSIWLANIGAIINRSSEISLNLGHFPEI